jgi:hypothetical protein
MEISGHKIFGSLSPVWTLLGLHAKDTSDPEHPQVIHAFLPRDADRYRIDETWDTLGMRATASNDTILGRTFIPDGHVTLVCPAGFAGAGPFHVALFAWALLGFGSVYAGIAQRAFDETVNRVHQRTSVALTRSMAYLPGVQHQIAEMRIALEGPAAHLDRACNDWASGVDHGMEWPLKIVACKYAVVNQAWSVVDTRLRPHRQRRHLQAQPLRAVVPRRPPRPHPPRQQPAHPRAGREDEPRDQPRRPTALGLTQGRNMSCTASSATRRSPRRLDTAVWIAPRAHAATGSCVLLDLIDRRGRDAGCATRRHTEPSRANGAVVGREHHGGRRMDEHDQKQ